MPIYGKFEKLNKFEKVLFYVKTGIFRKIDELLNFETPILRIFRAYLGAEWLQEYKLNPTQILNIKDIINNEFDEFVNKTTTYVTSHYSPKFD